MKNSKITLIFAAILLIGVIFVYILSTNASKTNRSGIQNFGEDLLDDVEDRVGQAGDDSQRSDGFFEDTETPNNNFNASLVANTTSWNSGEVYEVRLNKLGSIESDFNAVSLVITYDPEVIQLNSSKAGDIMERSFVEFSEIDNENGIATFDYTRIPETDLTQSSTVAVFEFEAVQKSSGSVLINVSPESFYTHGAGNAPAFKAESLAVEVN